MCNCYVPLHVHSHYSLLDGMPSPKKIVERAKEISAQAIAITDHGSIAGIVEHNNACKKLGIKPIAGIELYLCEHDPSIKTKENDKRYHLTILAKNQDGINDLIQLVNTTNNPNWYYRKPRIDLINLSQFAKRGNLICLSGCLAGELSSSIFTKDEIIIENKKYKNGVNAACSFGDTESKINNARQLLIPNWQDVAAQIIKKYQDAFGIHNYFIEIQEEGMISQKVVVECLRQVAKDLQIKSVATLDAHYLRKEDAEDHRLLLCAQMHTTTDQQEQIKAQGGDTMAFFYLDTFHIFSYEEMQQHYTDKEIETSLEIAESIENFSLNRKPKLPKFTNENHIDSKTYLQQLCIQGAIEKLKHLSKEQKQEYWKRLKRELLIVNEAGLADYFLIVFDACNFITENNGPKGVGRGSGAGCLINYLIGITGIDPIKYGLYFERFYNPSRNIPPHFDINNNFMQWYEKNFENLHTRNTEEEKDLVRQHIINNCKFKFNKLRLREEAAWIDNNNPKMWCFIIDSIEESVILEKPAESEMEYVIGLSQEPPNNKTKYNDGHTSLPDIDIDIGVKFREKVIEYLKGRWGEKHVSQMITFGRLQGKAALKEVFRAQPDLVRHLMKVNAVKLGKSPEEINITPHDLCNEITSYIPDEASIADELQEMRESTGESNYGILKWSIDNIEQIEKAYEAYKPLFDQAMRIEGTKKSQSRHAAGIVITDEPIEEFMPMTLDNNTKSKVVGVEMGNAESMGAVKFDFLGVTALDKIWFAQDLINKKSTELHLLEDFVETEESNIIGKLKRRIVI